MRRALYHEKLGNYSSACDCWSAYIYLQHNKPSIKSLVKLAYCYRRCLDYDEADKTYKKINSLYPDSKNGYSLRAENLVESGKYLKAEKQYLYVHNQYPNCVKTIVALCRLYDVKQDWALLYQFSRLIVENNIQQKSNLNLLTLYVKSLIGLHKIEKANSYFITLIKTCEHKPDYISALVNIGVLLRQTDRLEYNWEELLNEYSNNIQVHIAYVRYLSNLGNFSYLESYIKSFEKHASLYMQLYICSIHSFKFDEARYYLQNSSLLDDDPLKYHICITNTFILSWDNIGLQEKLRDLLDQELSNPNSLQLKLLLIKSYMRLNRIDEAAARIDKIDPWLAGREDISGYLEWRENIRGNYNRSKNININLSKSHYFPSIHSPISIKKLDGREFNHRKDDILLFSPMKNCIDILPWFLNYYRNLGVNYFYIVDNDSDDGTSEYLLNQKDVFLFYSDDSFNHNASGMRWINHLMVTYGGNSWCLFVDSDEALVFPGIENSSLRSLLSYMEKHGHEILPAFMLDLYPADIEALKSCSNISDKIKASVYFDNKYEKFNTTTCPYKAVRGGMRDRFFGTKEMLEKVPIIKGGRNILYTGNHSVTTGVCSDISVILLHYHMAFKSQLTNYEWDIDSDINIRTMSHHCRRRYSLYNKIHNTRESNHSFLCEKSTKYKSPKQLVELGLMNVPDNFVY